MRIPPPIRNSLRSNKLVRWIYFNGHLADIPVVLGLGNFKKQMETAISQFVDKNRLSEPAYIKSLTNDIKSCYIRYKITPQEYFLFRLSDKNQSERKDYLSDHLIMKLVADSSGRKIHDAELNDKYNFYKINRHFFKRNALHFNSRTSLDEFSHYALSAKRFIAKPNKAALGHGVELFATDNDIEVKNAYNRLKDNNVDYIIEDLIIQRSDMAIWNQSSVNTIRINSFLINNKFTLIYPFIRTGRKGSIVDNGGQGGIFASVDKDTGIICTEGMDEKGITYESHPDSKITYRGWQIPNWGELLQLTEQVHRNMPKHKYVSWDFALTDNGWVLIEGNWGEFVCQQMTYKRGLKKEFILMLKSK